ncbi:MULTISPECIES: hypothetical protein [Halorussus]|uniref:hypothetical protein n=1 Tax=Halorussus TaxID=1070314 RepID=UPI00209FDD13|nr:hypothetical protein [Halorussus vallis]USZ76555.1 hypothetical protein NGM07_04320 [Halorussus vallis]
MVSESRSSRRWEKGALLVGFVSLAAAVLLAHGSPPEAYELSIYGATPVAFWVGAAVALLVTIAVSLAGTELPRKLALLLGGTTMLAVASLPVIRSYYFFGAGDSLTHLGWAKDIAAGRLSVLGFLYPGTHTVAVFLADLTGMPIRRAMLVMVMAFTAVFLLFVPLATWAVTRDKRATTIAALAAFMFLPVNNISVFEMAHPTSQAILFLPLILYLVARYATDAGRDTLPFGTAEGVLLALTSVAIVLVHPQQAANVVLVFGALVVLQFVARWVGTAERDHRSLLLQTLFLVGVFAFWAPRHERASGASTALVNMLLHGANVGSGIQARAVSLGAIGGSFWMLFAKLFLVSAIFCGLAALLVLESGLGRVGDPDTSAFSRYYGLALVPLLGLFAAYLAVSYAQLHFRQLGFVMVLVTILGAMALSRFVGGLSKRTSSGTARTVLGVFVVAMLALSAPTIYQSPYMYQGTGHVTAAQMDGYSTAFEHTDQKRLPGIRAPGERFADGIMGYQQSRAGKPSAPSLYSTSANVTGQNFTGSRVASYLDGRYLAYTDATRQHEIQVYEGLRFPKYGFRSLDATPGVNRVQANRGFQLYRINRTA